MRRRGREEKMKSLGSNDSMIDHGQGMLDNSPCDLSRAMHGHLALLATILPRKLYL